MRLTTLLALAICSLFARAGEIELKPTEDLLVKFAGFPYGKRVLFAPKIFRATERWVYVRDLTTLHVFRRDSGELERTFSAPDGRISSATPIPYLEMICLTTTALKDGVVSHQTIFLHENGQFFGYGYDPDGEDPTQVTFRDLFVSNDRAFANIWQPGDNAYSEAIVIRELGLYHTDGRDYGYNAPGFEIDFSPEPLLAIPFKKGTWASAYPHVTMSTNTRGDLLFVALPWIDRVHSINIDSSLGKYRAPSFRDLSLDFADLNFDGGSFTPKAMLPADLLLAVSPDNFGNIAIAFKNELGTQLRIQGPHGKTQEIISIKLGVFAGFHGEDAMFYHKSEDGRHFIKFTTL